MKPHSPIQTFWSILFFVLPLIVILSACNGNAHSKNEETNMAKKIADSLRFATDTAGLAQFQAWKAQNELADSRLYGQEASTPISASYPVRRASSKERSGGTSGSGQTGTTTKNGWSKAAKGAVIGGVAGGVAGAVINKRNRVAGGVIGGVLGAGVGYGIGRKMDKKDGRY